MMTSFRKSPLYVVVGAFFLFFEPNLRAELIQVLLSGEVTDNFAENSEAPVGTPWQLSFVCDTTAPDDDAANSGHGLYLPPTVPSFTFTLAGFSVDLSGPATAEYPTININAIPGGPKDFIVQLSAPSLGMLGGQSVSTLTLVLDDGSFGGFSDGLDTLPFDYTLTRASFQDCRFQLVTNVSAINCSVDTVSFAPVAVPEPSLIFLIGVGAIVLFVSRAGRRSELQG